MRVAQVIKIIYKASLICKETKGILLLEFQFVIAFSARQLVVDRC